jgi:hypothetical protein
MEWMGWGLGIFKRRTVSCDGLGGLIQIGWEGGVCSLLGEKMFPAEELRLIVLKRKT